MAPQTGMEDAIRDRVVLLLSDNDQTMPSDRQFKRKSAFVLHTENCMWAGMYNFYVSNFVLKRLLSQISVSVLDCSIYL